MHTLQQSSYLALCSMLLIVPILLGNAIGLNAYLHSNPHMTDFITGHQQPMAVPVACGINMLVPIWLS